MSDKEQYTQWEKEIIKNALKRMIWQEQNIWLVLEHNKGREGIGYAPDLTETEETEYMNQSEQLVQKLLREITGGE